MAAKLRFDLLSLGDFRLYRLYVLPGATAGYRLTDQDGRELPLQRFEFVVDAGLGTQRCKLVLGDHTALDTGIISASVA